MSPEDRDRSSQSYSDMNVPTVFVMFPAVTHLIGYVLHLADGRVPVTAGYSVDRPTYVDVVLLQVHGVGQIHGLPVAAGGGA